MRIVGIQLHRLLPLCLVAVACTAPGSPPREKAAPPTDGASPTQLAGPAGGRFDRLVCDLPTPLVERLRNGHLADRSGEIQFVLRPPNFFRGWSHSGPWKPLQQVPLFFYGPGHVPALGRVHGPVTLTSVAPTLARFLRYDFGTPDGESLNEAVLGTGEPPRLILVVVWDAAGRNVLKEYPAEWAPVRRLIPDGAWFENATVGTSPSMTPPVHATIGTGVYPRRHGILDFVIRDGDDLAGSIGEGPKFLAAPTLADLYDRDLGNRPIVGLVSWEPTLGMLGHGSFLEGGDRDLALVTRHGEWGLSARNRDHFRFEPYVVEVPGLQEEARALDLQDGLLDGMWLGTQPLATALDVEYTPAYSSYQTGVLEEVLREEGFGRDGTPDLLFTNYKQIDRVAHIWSFPSEQMRQVVARVAQELVRLVRILDGEVGEDRWVLVLTADHGATPLAQETGAFVIDREELEEDLMAATDRDSDARSPVKRLLETQLWINMPELQENGYTLEDIADFLMGYTAADNAVDPSAVPEELRDERLFRAAFPGAVLDGLPCV